MQVVRKVKLVAPIGFLGYQMEGLRILQLRHSVRVVHTCFGFDGE